MPYKRLLILLLVLFVSNVWAGNGTIIDFSDGWEGFYPNLSGPSVVREIRKDDTTFCASFSGNKVAYHEINYDNGSTYRSESQRYEWAPVIGDEKFGFKVFLPETYVYDNLMEAIYQSKRSPDRDDNGTMLETWGNPCFMIYTCKGKWGVIVRSQAMKISPPEPNLPRTKFELGKYEVNKWTTFEVHIKWDWAGQGSVKVWIDKMLVMSVFPFAVGYNDDRGTYSKIGLYKWDWKVKVGTVTKRSIYHDDFWRIY